MCYLGNRRCREGGEAVTMGKHPYSSYRSRWQPEAFSQASGPAGGPCTRLHAGRNPQRRKGACYRSHQPVTTARVNMASELGGGGGGLVFSTSSCRQGGRGCGVGLGGGGGRGSRPLPPGLEQTFRQPARLLAGHCLAPHRRRGANPEQSVHGWVSA